MPVPDSVPRLRTALIGLTCTAAVGILGGCGSASSAGAAATSSGTAMHSSMSMGSSAASSSTVVIHISKFAYQAPTSVAPGATVTVMNMDGEAHTVTADSGGAFDTKVDPGKTSTFTAPTKPGSYAFHCTYHGNMHGTLVVK